MPHTPGPWTVICRNRRLPGGRGMGFDVIQAWRDAWDGEIICDRATEADARLIAAAPELLAVLSALLDSPNAKQNALWDQARAAVAKACEG